jgi:hypothetical protein
MIRYPKALDDLELKIEAKYPGWLKRAKDRTEKFEIAGCYDEKSSIWSEIKPLYMSLQKCKCIYCEMEGECSAIQWELEHFRPKSNVRKWPPAKSDFNYDFDLGGDSKGYHLLAYHPQNYSISCKTCNTPYKSDYFPVAAPRIEGKPHPTDYLIEQALLVYPLGMIDEDPEDLILFNGVQAEPAYTREEDLKRWRRGRVMIDFFGLNRDGLQYLRAKYLLRTILPHYNSRLKSPNDPDIEENHTFLRSEKAPFSSCTKCFFDTCEIDGSHAQDVREECEKIIKRIEAG